MRALSVIGAEESADEGGREYVTVTHVTGGSTGVCISMHVIPDPNEAVVEEGEIPE